MPFIDNSRIEALRRLGYGYKSIAAQTGVPINTVKTVLRRLAVEAEASVCPTCGAELINTPHHKKKRFCSDKCRIAWWNTHRDQLRGNGEKSHVCSYCGKPFINRTATSKYCSRECYGKARRKDGSNE